MPAVGNSGDYATRVPVFVNNVPLEEVTSVEATLDTGITEVFTTSKGFAGFASGAKLVTVRINSAVPISGLEVDVWKLAGDEEWVTLQIGVGRGDFASNGKIPTAGISHSVNNPVESSFEWRGPYAALE